MSELRRLSDSQSTFAADNHDVIFRFLNRRQLPENEYYDIVVFGFLQAVQQYDERPELRKYAFSTIANKRMFAALWNHFRSQRTAKRSAKVLSLNAPVKGGGELLEYIADPGHAIHDSWEAQEQWLPIYSAITPKQLDVLELRRRGYTNREISKICQTTPCAVYGRTYRLRKKTERLLMAA